MSTTGQNNNNDTQKIGTGTVIQNNNNDTQKIDNDTVKIGGGGGALSGANIPSMGNGAGIMPQQNAQMDTGTPQNKDEVFTDRQVIELNGKKYTIENCISMGSGEAVIYKVNSNGMPFVLKHYKLGNHLPEPVLSIIKDNPQSRIIKLFDYGHRNNQDYEIMEYAEGGTLDQYLNKNPIKDITILKNIVRQINEGLEQLHGLKIIYQDLKPKNIFFRNVNRTEIILADFGISSVMPPGEEKVEVPANATTVYAAPELARIGNEKNVMVGPSVDYFALGITMLQLWLGDTPFSDISEAKRSNQIREKNVKFPPDMDTNYKILIQGLIQPLPNERWGKRHISKWLAGESLESNYNKVSSSYEQQMFNKSESYATPAELAALLAKYPDDGKTGLYSSDFITKWIRNAGDNFLASKIEEIKTTYAANKDAGLYLAIYALDPDRPFISHGGRNCSATTEIADAIMAESEYYMEELKKANAQLYLYIEAGAGKDIAEQLHKNFEDKEYSPRRALNLVYLKLQSDGGQSIKIGSKTYQNPEEVAAEKDGKQIDLIKKAIQEEDSLFLVWLSDHYGEFFSTTGGFYKLNLQDKFYLLSKFPFLSYKEFYKNNWEQAAINDLVLLVHTSPGRFDLFEAYAAQGLPFSGQSSGLDWRPTALGYLTSFLTDLTDIKTGLELVHFLHKHGAYINEESGNGTFPLFNAVCKRNAPLVELLLELGADPDKTRQNIAPLFWALYNLEENEEEPDRITIARLLLNYKANANIFDANGRNALAIAIQLESPERIELVSQILKAGTDINYKDENGFTPLHIAVTGHHLQQDKQSALEVIELLLKKGAKTEMLIKSGFYSPLMAAADVNDIDAAEMLLNYGARKDFADINDETAFIYAAKKKYSQMMDIVAPGSDFILKCRLFLLLKTAVSVLAIGLVFLTIDVLARAILTFHLSYPVLLGVSPLLSHLLTAYILIVIFGHREYLIRLRGTFNFIGGGLRYLLGVPIVFPLLVLPLTFLTRFLPAQITSALSYPAEYLTRPSAGFAILSGYIVLLAAIMAVTVFVNRVNEKYSRQWYMYRYYSGTIKASSGAGRKIIKFVLVAVIIGLVVFMVSKFKNSSNAANVGVELPDVKALVENGQKYYEKGDYNNAIKQFDEVIKNDPRNVLGYAWRGNSYRRMNQFDMAIKDLSEAISLDPKYSFAYSRRGEAYRAKGDNKSALKDFNEALALDPNDSWAYGSRGQAYKQMGQTEQAIQDFKKAISLDPGIEWVKKELQSMEVPKAAVPIETLEETETTETTEN